MVLVNGDKGEVVVDPDDDQKNAFIEQEKKAEEARSDDRAAAQAPAVTADGEHVEVVANIGGLFYFGNLDLLLY